MRLFVRLTAAGFAAAFLATGLPAASFADYPEKTIDYIIPFGAGGGTDRWGRVMASVSFDVWGQAWRVRNVPGASGVVGWKSVLDKPADGYMLLQGSPTPVLGLLLEDKPPLDPEKDIKICAIISSFRSYLLARTDAPFKNYDEFKAYAKANPKKVTLAGTLSHLIGQANFMDQAGLDLTYVSYDGTGKASADFLGGHVMTFAATELLTVSLVPEKARAILNASDLANPKSLEEKVGKVPSAPDLKIEGISFPRWIGVHPKTPDAICQRISDLMDKTLKTKSVMDLLDAISEEIVFVPMAEAQKKYLSMVKAMRKSAKLLK